MSFLSPTLAQKTTRPFIIGLALLSASLLWAQSATPAANVATAAPLPKGQLAIDGPWRFEIGDDPRWADPAFDDSSWRTVQLSKHLADQGIEQYTGFAWYRLRLQPGQIDNSPSAEQSELLVTGYATGQLAVFINGNQAARTRGMEDGPLSYQSPPLAVSLSAASPSGPPVIAIRSWVSQEFPVEHGALGSVEVGPHSAMAQEMALRLGYRWNEFAASSAILALLFFCMSVFGAALYASQRHHVEYLWLTALCLAVAFGGLADAIYALGGLTFSAHRVFTYFMGRIFMAVTLEFVLRFTASPSRRGVRAVQGFVLLLPFVYLFGLNDIYDVLSVAGEVVFCAFVTVLLFRAWRRGQHEAGVMLAPFFLAGVGGSVDTLLSYAAGAGWLPRYFADHRFHLGPVGFDTGIIAYVIFLASLALVILYRFIRVSQDEQRSAAEIAAARSVQKLLIPTELPSNRNFMLESAYLPINGVGGDFFQVLPLNDDSLLVVVGDVSGKGLQAAMNSSTLVGALRNELAHDPATVLSHLNNVLIGAVSSPGAAPGFDAAPGFATCLCARVYPDGTLTIANAGHLSPYRDGRELELLPGLPLGVVAGLQYEQSTFHLSQGDRLVFLSDGVVEATNTHGELFGFERTQQVSNEPPRYIAQTAQRFGQNDDITVVSLYLASSGAARERQKQPSNI